MNIALAVSELSDVAWSVAIAVLPLTALFGLFQLFILKLPRPEVSRILTGTLMASAGLFLFLLGVSLGFLPFGRAIGESVGSISQKWLLVPFGFLLGFVTTWSEPAVRILADQVEEASTGSIRRSLVLWAVCIAVAVAVSVGMVRIGSGIPLLYLLVPGYVLAMTIMWWSDRGFVSIAIDASGVATGPLANTFLLSIALGASSVAGNQNPLVHGLGLVALISLAPLISVIALGLVVRRKERKES